MYGMDLESLLGKFLVPPPMPAVKLGWGAERAAIEAVCKHFYFTGTYHGFVAGLAVAGVAAFIVSGGPGKVLKHVAG